MKNKVLSLFLSATIIASVFSCLTASVAVAADDWRTHPEDYKLVAFTFDDAPSYSNSENNITTRLIDLLNKYDGAGTLFVTGDNIRENGTELLKYAIDNGFELGNHTDTHPYLTSLSHDQIKAEIENVNSVVKRELNYTIKYIRPPYVAYNNTVIDVATELNMPIIGEGIFDENSNLVMLGDWGAAGATQDTIYSNCMNYAENGSIILLHGWANMTDAALAKLIPDMYANGYRFATLSELFEYHNIKNVPTDRLIQSTKFIRPIDSFVESAVFNATYYSDKYPDLKSAYENDATKLREHFFNYGISEGRQASPIFNIDDYINYNPDLTSRYNNNKAEIFRYFITTGWNEPRLTASPIDIGSNYPAEITNLGDNKNLTSNISDNNILTAEKSNLYEQAWIFMRHSDGSYKIVNRKNNLCIEAEEDLSACGVNIVLRPDNGTDAQRWYLQKATTENSNKYILQAKIFPCYVMNVTGSSAEISADIQGSPYDGSNAQYFYINEIVYDEKDDESVIFHTHNYILENSTTQTYIENGSQTFICESCGNKKVDILYAYCDTDKNGIIDNNDQTILTESPEKQENIDLFDFDGNRQIGEFDKVIIKHLYNGNSFNKMIDVNGDDKSDLVDLIRAKKIQAGKSQGNMDFNLDGTSNAADLVFIKNFILNLDSKFQI